MQNRHRILDFLPAPILLPLFIAGIVAIAFAEGTHTWEQSKFEELTKGTATGVAVRSGGGLELAPAFKLLYGTPSTYVWAVAADGAHVVIVRSVVAALRSHHL